MSVFYLASLVCLVTCMVVGCLLACRSGLYDLYVGRLACLLIWFVYWPIGLYGLSGWSDLVDGLSVFYLASLVCLVTCMLIGCLLVCWSDLYDLYVGRLACLVCLVGLFYLVGWSSLAVNRLVYCSVCWYAGQLTIIVAQWRIGSGQ